MFDLSWVFHLTLSAPLMQGTSGGVWIFECSDYASSGSSPSSVGSW